MQTDQIAHRPSGDPALPGPLFLGIGVPKGASTWLYDLLGQHPDVKLAPPREVHFFDREEYFARGLDWYAKLFPAAPEWNSFKAIGEITPTYFYCDEQRIEYIANNLPEINKFICIFRNPIDRCYSHYKFAKRVGEIQSNLTFEDFLGDYGDSCIGIRHSFYAKSASNWLDQYNDDQFLNMIFEEIFQDIDAAKRQIADFLGLDASRFPDNAGEQAVNKDFAPRFPKAYAFAVKAGKKLRDTNLYGVESALRKLGIKRLLAKNKTAPQAPERMQPDTRQRLTETFSADVQQLEKTMGRNISAWKDFAPADLD